MRSLIILLALMGALSTLPPARAEGALTGASVTIQGKTVPADPVPVAAAPGVSFGLTLTPQGSPAGAPVILEVQLARPGDSLEAPLLRWMVASVVGQPADATWEFAYDWEIIPGDWFMSVSCEGTELAKATFRVAPALAGTAPQPNQPTQTAAAKGTPDKKTAQQPGRNAQERKDNGKAMDVPAGKSEPVKADMAKNGATKGESGKTGEAGPVVAKTGPVKPDAAISGAARPEQGKAEDAKTGAVKADAPSAQSSPAQPRPEPKPSAPPQQDSRVRVGGAPDSTVHVLVGGTYSEEARALWVAVFLRKNGVKACVREQDKGGRRLWAVVTGWAADPDQARRMRQEQTPVVGDILIFEMTVADLEKGLNCP